MNAEQPKTIRLADYRAPDYRIDAVTLDFDLGEEVTRVKARMEIRGVGGRPLVLDGEDLKLIALALDDRPLRHGDHRLADTSRTRLSGPALWGARTHTLR